jgi:hypothetical protein
MGLSLIQYVIEPLPLGRAWLLRTVESAGPEDMEKRIAQVIAEIVKINEDIVDSKDKFDLADVDLAGGGDGHTFVAILSFTRAKFSGLGIAVPPDTVRLGAYMASQRDAIDAAFNLTVTRLVQASTLDPKNFTAIFQPIRGASQGTRFMGLVVGAPLSVRVE